MSKNVIGFDVGTYTLVTARPGVKDNEVKYNKDINAFVQFSVEDRKMINMLKNSSVPLFEKNDVAYIMGDAAINFAKSFKTLELRRPMKDGCLNPTEKDAFRILMSMIHSLIGEVEEDQTIVYYSVPSNATNVQTDADFHQKVLEDIFKKYHYNGKILKAFPINEALALIYAELAHKAFTGLGVSCGAGQVNVCYAMYSLPVVKFSLVNSGDWIDKQAALATNESISYINKAKHSIDLTKTPTNAIERAIQAQYHIMIDHTVSGIKTALTQKETEIKADDPVDIILAGGTVSPNGFLEIFTEEITKAKLPIPIGEIRKPVDNLLVVARGCLVAAQNA
jgi:actin-like ATPase involved in cell morphogenesis